MKLFLAAALTVASLAAQPRPAAKKKSSPPPKPAASAKPAPAPAFPIASLTVEGNKIHSTEKILALAGLKVGMPVSQPAFEAARDKLLQCGFFETVGYKYGPSKDGAGYNASFTVVEVQQVFPVYFDRLPESAAELKAALTKADPLFSEKVPGTDPVLKRYAAILQTHLGSKINDRVVGKVQSEGPDDLRIVFQPATLPPSIAEIRFVKNEVINSTTLQNRIAGPAVGSVYEEKKFRQMLDANLRPMYEQRGRIRVAFNKITVEPVNDVNGLRVTVEVNEGEAFTLGEINVHAADMPANDLLKAAGLKKGDLANFEEINAGIDRMRQVYRRAGYLNAKANTERKPKDSEKVVDLEVTIEPGDRYTFQKLNIAGLDIVTEPHIRKLWTPKPGDPFNPEYPNYFMARIKEDGILENLGKTRVEVKTDDVKKTAEVTLHFR